MPTILSCRVLDIKVPYENCDCFAKIRACEHAVTSAFKKSGSTTTRTTPVQIEIARGNDVQLRTTFVDKGGEIMDLSNIASLNIKVMRSQTDEEILLDTTLASSDTNFSSLPTLADYEAGTDQHALFTLSAAQTNFKNPQCKEKFNLWMVMTATTSDTEPKTITLAGDTICICEDNNDAAGTPPENPGTACTCEEVAALIAALAYNTKKETGSIGAGDTVVSVTPPTGCTWENLTDISVKRTAASTTKVAITNQYQDGTSGARDYTLDGTPASNSTHTFCFIFAKVS